MNPDYMFVFDTSISATFYLYICTMLLLYQFVSNRFGKKMHIADENRRILAGKGDNTLNEDENSQTSRCGIRAGKNHYEPSIII